MLPLPFFYRLSIVSILPSLKTRPLVAARKTLSEPALIIIGHRERSLEDENVG